MTVGAGRRSRDVPSLVARAREGDARSVARLISLVENGDPALPEVAAAMASHAGRAQVVGLTGAPGVGKSTTTNELVRALREAGNRVGVLAVDPSSPFTGGAILGDRIRMQDHTADSGVYIRSMSSRGQLGGLSAATPQAVRVLEGAGCDVILVETVGVGQAEVEIASLADTTLVLLAPGMGDAIQAVKAGVLEIADVFVINKADRPGADATYRDIQGMLALGERGPGEWRPQVVRAVAVKNEGIDDVVAAIGKHREWLESTGNLRRRREHRAAVEISALALGTLRARMGDLRGGATLPELAARVADGDLDPHAAAAKLLESL
ncbi:methylmalonyl Co-A mutase-associated GTPase MeaB [Actinoplanes xinjiangensis]|uniref:LAO/AO transport system kinase n=1 Tax=Actinoplanes xinjiangensis TaxID=512350 RepID=A0A316FNR0_9ACTN|nr:methylmalonyl Co-A mutase-associated GTPase MeaB [Actinoplanes xinjiangensis]PWK50471.1 LAO/AO transport system kinase [Actinoplanes xinjiangensis]GIF36357.1 transporter [Actinoplanes xinjiangensis]